MTEQELGFGSTVRVWTVFLEGRKRDRKGPIEVAEEVLDKVLVERVMEAELTAHLCYEKHDPVGYGSGNSRNRKSKKQLKGEFGELQIEMPRHRQHTFAGTDFSATSAVRLRNAPLQKLIESPITICKVIVSFETCPDTLNTSKWFHTILIDFTTSSNFCGTQPSLGQSSIRSGEKHKGTIRREANLRRVAQHAAH